MIMEHGDIVPDLAASTAILRDEGAGNVALQSFASFPASESVIEFDSGDTQPDQNGMLATEPGSVPGSPGSHGTSSLSPVVKANTDDTTDTPLPSDPGQPQPPALNWRQEALQDSQGSLKDGVRMLYRKRFLAYRLFSILVLLTGLALVVMHAGGQLAVPVFSSSVSSGIIDKQTASSPGDVRPAGDAMSITFCVLWACTGLVQVSVIAIVVYRMAVPAQNRKLLLSSAVWRLPDASPSSSKLQNLLTQSINLVIDLTEKTALQGSWFWRRCALYLLLDTVFQMEALFSYGGFSLLKRQSIAPVEDWPILVTHAVLIALDMALTSHCFYTGNRYMAEVFMAFGDIGYTLDRLLIVKPAPDTSPLDPRNWHVFRAADTLAFLTDITPILGLASGLLAVDGFLQTVELAQLQEGGAESQLEEASASWVFRIMTPTSISRTSSSAAAVQQLSAAAHCDGDGTTREAELEAKPLPRARTHWKTLVLHLLAVAAGTGLVAFVCFQQFLSECGHVSEEACSWRVHPLAEFPSCNCQISTALTFNISSGECNDVPAALQRGHQRTIFLFVSDTPPAFKHCALHDADIHAILSSLPFLVTLNSPHQNAELRDQALIPLSPQLRYIDLFRSPMTHLSLDLAQRLPNLDELYAEYAQVESVDEGLLDLWGVRVIRLFSAPLCRDGGTPELRAMQERHPGRLLCEPEFASSAEVTALLDDQDVYCGTGDRLTDPLHVLFTALRVQCLAYGAAPNHECLPMCAGMVAFEEEVDADGDGYLSLSEVNVIAPLYAGREFESQEELECVIRNLDGCEPPRYADKWQIKVLYIGITGDEIRGVVGSDCSECTML